MKLFYSMYIWLVVMIQTFKSDLPAQTEEEKAQLLRLDLQFFADDLEDDPVDDPEDDPDDEDPEDDSLNLAELMKDPAFKKQYNQKLKEQLGKRMKKFEGVDPEEYKRLKAAADKDSSGENDKSNDSAQEKRLLRAERREKQAVVKEFAVENGHNPKLLARLIDIDAIELDDQGEPENLDELFDELEEDFPEYFGASDDDQEESGVKKKSFTPGSKQKGNKKKKIDPYAAGAERAKQRHSKGDDK